jgi:adenylate cyclase
MAAGQEIERKFLVDGVPDGIEWSSEETLRQGYLALDGDTEVRIRLGDAPGGTVTVKHGGGRSRVEEEMDVDERQAESLWELTEGRRVEKVRRRTDVDGYQAEVDEYRGDLSGMVVAEVEFPDDGAAGAFEPPGWFGREVTDNPAYKNRRLATDGRPEEKD